MRNVFRVYEVDSVNDVLLMQKGLGIQAWVLGMKGKDMRIDSVEELTECLSFDGDIFLYGCGAAAKKLTAFAKMIGKESVIKGYLRTEQPSSLEYVEGKAVLRFEDASKIIKGSRIIVSTTEQYHASVVQALRNEGFEKYYLITDGLLDELSISLKCASANNRGPVGAYDRIIPMPQLSFSVHLCEHCNLNCAGCNNFSPLANENYADIDIFEKDMSRLSELSGGDAYRISLTGGEPLLNPRAKEYAIIARRAFPNSRIAFISNGLLVRKMNDDFWDTCVENDICLDLTTYPINLDYISLGKYIIEKGVKGRFFNGSTTKVWTKEKLDLAPIYTRNPAVDNWMRCYKVGDCMQLYNGKMACTTVMNAKYLMESFPSECADMYYTERDFIDINKVKSITDIFDFFARPFPFCKYCKPGDIEIVEWAKSEKVIGEWI